MESGMNLMYDTILERIMREGRKMKVLVFFDNKKESGEKWTQTYAKN